MKLSKSTGFSLIELMIVVAIIAILAAIAIPNFLKFSMKAKTAEATQNLAAMRTSQESYRSEEDTYWTCAANPAAWAAGAGASTPIAWDAGVATWDAIGFSPDGNVRYQYACTGGDALAAANVFTATATGDLDEDGASCIYKISNDPADLDGAADDYPKPFKGGTGPF